MKNDEIELFVKISTAANACGRADIATDAIERAMKGLMENVNRPPGPEWNELCRRVHFGTKRWPDPLERMVNLYSD